MDRRLLHLSFIGLLALGGLAPRVAPTRAATGVYRDLVLDEARDRIYASGGAAGAAVAILSLTTLQPVGSLPLAAEAAGLDLAPGGGELAVAVPDAHQLVFVDLDATQVITTVLPTYAGQPSRLVDVVYGRPGRLYATGAFDFSRPDAVHVFDTTTYTDLVQGGAAASGPTQLAVTADGTQLYLIAPAVSLHDLFRFDVSTDALTQTAQRTVMAAGGLNVAQHACLLDDGRLATDSGQIWSADLSAPAQTLSAQGTEVACSGQALYFTEGTTVRAVAAGSGQTLWTFNLGVASGPVRLNAAGDRVYVSTASGVRAFGTTVQPRAYLPELHAPRFGIYGRVTLNGVPTAQRMVQLQRWKDSRWLTLLYTLTDARGDYLLVNPPSLEADWRYRVVVESVVPGEVHSWTTASITTFQTGASLDLGSFDIAGILPLAPGDGAVVGLPQTFQWTTRPASPDDRYAFDLYQTCCFYEEFFTGALGYVDRYTLTGVPAGFQATGSHDYRWEPVILDAQGGYGLSQAAFAIGFQPAALPGLPRPEWAPTPQAP